MNVPRHVRRAMVLRDARARASETSTMQRVRTAILLRDTLTEPLRPTDMAAPRAVTR